MTPSLSVLLPVRDGEPWLRQSIASILAQSHPHFELLVIDDGSTDGSRAIACASGDARVRLLSSHGRGLAAALNTGLHAAAGVYVARQDADDLSLPHRLERQVAFLDSTPSVDVVTSRVAFIDGDGVPHRDAWTASVESLWESALDHEAIAALLSLTCCVVHGSVMARRDVLLHIGGYDEGLEVAQDYDLWLRLLPEHRFARLPDRLYAFRVHDRQVSAAAREAQSYAAIGAKLRHLRRIARLPDVARAVIVGGGRGAELYRRAFGEHGFGPACEEAAWDVAAFTQFATLDADMAAFSLAGRPAWRIGNFLVRGTP